MKRKLLLIDTETAGLNPDAHSLLSVAALVLNEGAVEDSLYMLVNEGEIVLGEGGEALKVNGLSLEQVRAAGLSPVMAVNTLAAMLQKNDMREGVVVVAHKASFDTGFLQRLYRLAGADYNAQFSHRSLCTHTAALLLDQAGRIDLPGGSPSLENVAAYFKVPLDRSAGHNALNDATALAHVFNKMLTLLRH